jgi:hypothetical protein
VVSIWLQIQRSRVRFSALPDFLRSSASGSWSTRPQQCRNLYIHSPALHLGVTFNSLSTGTIFTSFLVCRRKRVVLQKWPEHLSVLQTDSLQNEILPPGSKTVLFYRPIKTADVVKCVEHCSYKKTPWSESASELYRPSDRLLSAK